jgi:hypothetical protein
MLLLLLPLGWAPLHAGENPFSRPSKAAKSTTPVVASLPASPVMIAPPVMAPIQDSPSDVGNRELPPVSQPLAPDPQSLPAVEEIQPQESDDQASPFYGDLDVETDFSLPQQNESPLFGKSIYGDGRLARIKNDRIVIPTLIAPTTDITDIGSRNRPQDIGGKALDQSTLLPEGFDRNEDWLLTQYFWQAPNTFSHPLYFEDVMLERHGHERCPCLTPVLSGVRFFATIPMLPYLGAVREPCDCVYTLGYHRPGSCAPRLLQRPPYERRAAVIQAAATAGAFIAIP